LRIPKTKKVGAFANKPGHKKPPPIQTVTVLALAVCCLLVCLFVACCLFVAAIAIALVVGQAIAVATVDASWRRRF
jgi:hypothetical protein